ncbi:trypsin-like peptidase domain-containing protein [Parasedimentitalea maritima]|uniref:Peptidoglycan-binding protein n=1 Tax=Parasedimentitalea maritima TaxID=2578117 RepID=A0A6A4RKU6_9RHOB|nr:trypsin-like peptidase domain-containing protein [Zongyanglinia marina]KAE9630176.1 peptidoglycan-binding protein [Zongyanglinia marina]
MKTFFASMALTLMALAATLPKAATAQQVSPDSVWIQIAAHASLTEAQGRASSLATQLPDVSGYALGGGWYGVVLGPYSRADAERALQVYRREGNIPRDSFIAFGRNLGQQFWPQGATSANVGVTTLPATIATETAQVDTSTAQPVPTPQVPDETAAQARRSERALTADERKALQIALKAAGFYNSAIDGSFGRGTRASMNDWQAANGYELTGILTTRQRQALLDEYNAPLISVGMAEMTNASAGISMQIPAREVGFSRYEPPFAHFDAKGDIGARVLLISQPGDQRTLFGLYDILQTLEIVPLVGPRERGNDSFTIEGRGNGIVSFTQASLKNGEIKGFTLIWPAGDENRRSRVLTEMQSSFARLEGVLDPAAGGDAQQSIDLLAGLQIRQPRISRSGFYVDAQGTVLTTSDVVANCTRLTLDHDYPAELQHNDAANGLAVLRPTTPLAPMALAEFSASTPRLQSEVAVSGFSYEGLLGAPSLTWGTLADIKSLDGNSGVARLELPAQPGDVGGPVLDGTGAVLGMLLPQKIGAQQLPQGVSFAANAEAIRLTLSEAGVTASDRSADATTLSNAAMNRVVNGMTVLVSCWN